MGFAGSRRFVAFRSAVLARTARTCGDGRLTRPWQHEAGLALARGVSRSVSRSGVYEITGSCGTCCNPVALAVLVPRAQRPRGCTLQALHNTRVHGTSRSEMRSEVTLLFAIWFSIYQVQVYVLANANGRTRKREMQIRDRDRYRVAETDREKEPLSAAGHTCSQSLSLRAPARRLGSSCIIFDRFIIHVSCLVGFWFLLFLVGFAKLARRDWTLERRKRGISTLGFSFCKP